LEQTLERDFLTALISVQPVLQFFVLFIDTTRDLKKLTDALMAKPGKVYKLRMVVVLEKVVWTRIW